MLTKLTSHTARKCKPFSFAKLHVLTCSARNVYSFPITPENQRFEALALYKQTLKLIPWIKETYNISLPIRAMKSRIRDEFEKYRQVRDPRVIEQLIFKGYQELEECQDHFKQRSHVSLFFSEKEMRHGTRPHETFEDPVLKLFFAGDPEAAGDISRFLKDEEPPLKAFIDEPENLADTRRVPTGDY